MLFSTSGDQVLAYQGSESSPTFIHALNNEGAGVWQAGATSTSFQVWQDSAPYFTPDPVHDTPLATPIVASYTDANVLGNPAANLYYVVTGVNDCGEASTISNRVGKFEFTLVPGQP